VRRKKGFSHIGIVTGKKQEGTGKRSGGTNNYRGYIQSLKAKKKKLTDGKQHKGGGVQITSKVRIRAKTAFLNRKTRRRTDGAYIRLGLQRTSNSRRSTRELWSLSKHASTPANQSKKKSDGILITIGEEGAQYSKKEG